MAYNHLAAQTHAAHDVAELAVAVGALVEVHEVHVDFVPGNFGVELGMEVEDWLVELLEAVNPHLGGREGVHPCDYADAFVGVIGSLHQVEHFARGVGGTFIYYFYREIAGVVETVDHLLRVGVDLNHGVAAVKELGTGNPPDFHVFVCVHDRYVFVLFFLIISDFEEMRE